MDRESERTGGRSERGIELGDGRRWKGDGDMRMDDEHEGVKQPKPTFIQ